MTVRSHVKVQNQFKIVTAAQQKLMSPKNGLTYRKGSVAEESDFSGQDQQELSKYEIFTPQMEANDYYHKQERQN